MGKYIGGDVLAGADGMVIQGVKTGAGRIIGAGSMVLPDVPENTKAAGVWALQNRKPAGGCTAGASGITGQGRRAA